MKHYTILFLVLLIFGCQAKEEKNTAYRWVEDISFDPKIDNPDFKICNGEASVFQYFNLGNGMLYKGEKKALQVEVFSQYKAVQSTDSGLIRIRFVVNCEGETDRFRMIAMDNDYQEKVFDKRITDQLLEISKSLKGWLTQTNEDFGNEPLDYYQYLIFKIDNGKLIELLP